MIDYTPRPHQALAGEFLQQHKRGALFLDMGLGKTVVTLTHLSKLMYEDFAVGKALVIAPKRVAEDTWTREAAKWSHLSHLTVSKVMGTLAQRRAALARNADIYVINRENVVWLTEELGANFDFDCVIIDELSSFKSSSSKRWKALRKLIFTAPYFYGLTGTPAPNGYLDLWPQVYFIDRGERLGSTITSYRQTYFKPLAQKGYVVYKWGLLPNAKENIDRKLADVCLSMSKEDWLKLPPRTFNTVPVYMSESEWKLYEQLQRDKVLPLLNGEAVTVEDDYTTAVTGDMAATLSGKLLQMANGAVYDDDGNVIHIHDAKLEALSDIVEDAQGQPLLVFYTYKHDLARITKKFPQAVVMGSGKTEDTIAKWNRGDIPMLLCHPASAGHGLNLQEGGHIIVWFGLPWSLELYQQANDRLHRMGQDKPVVVHHLITQDTVDERVLAALTSKDATQKGLLDALKQYIKEVAT